MSFRSLASLRVAASFAALLVLSACSDDRQAQLSEVETIEIPAADAGPQANQNISNPTLVIPETFPVADGDELTLVWSDEFDGPEIDPEIWFFATGDGTEKGLPGGWGNNELQYYLPDNAMIVNGILQITARRETVGDFDYTSARINTEDRFAFKYGRIESRIKLPAGQGIWPAFWMLSQDSAYQCDGEPCNWAATGEIDIMEAVNLDGTGGNDIFGTLHFGGESPANQQSGTRYTPGVDVTDDFHIYALEWDEFEIRWFFDGQLYAMQNSWSSTAAPFPAPFDQPFHVLLNVAVGGNFPGSPNGTTPWPVTMEVDWVRVYSGEEPPLDPADPGTIPDDVIYASDPGETVDLVFGVDYTGFDVFTSGTVLDNNVTTDADFNPAFGVTTGNGYGEQIGQFAIVGFDAGFAAGYATLDFKVKGMNEDLIRLKLLGIEDFFYVDITLTSSALATDLGNGWYQVSVPITVFGNAATADGLLFETGGTPPESGFTFLLTDFGFSGTAGGSGGGTGGGGGGGGGGTAGNIVVNGGFESGDFSGWETTPGGGTQAITTDNPSSGTYAANITVPVRTQTDPGIDNLLKAANLQAGNLTPGESVTVSFDMRGSLSGAGGVVFAELFSEQSGGGASKSELLSGGPLAPDADWTTYSFTTTLGPDVSGGVSLLLKASCGPVEGCGVDVFFDNVSIEAGSGGGTGGGGGGGGGGTGGGTGSCGGAGELAINCDFETGDFSGWETFPGGGIQAITTDNPSSGTYAANLNVPVRSQTDPAVDNLIKNANLGAGNLTPGASATVSFDMRGSLSGAGGVVFAEFFSELTGGGTSKAEIFSGGALAPTTDWTNYSFTTTLGPDVSGGVTLQLKTSCGPVEGCGVDAYFDNVSIVID